MLKINKCTNLKSVSIGIIISIYLHYPFIIGAKKIEQSCVEAGMSVIEFVI